MPETFAGTFATPSAALRRRADVHFVALAGPLNEVLSTSRHELRPLGELVERIQYGSSQRAEVEPEPGDVPIVRMPNIQDDRLDTSNLKYVPASELLNYRLEHGDILINRTNGSRDLVGKCAMFDREGDWVFASYLIRVRVRRDVVEPSYVAAYLSTEPGRMQMLRFSRQILMANINTEELRQVMVPVPSLAEQRQLMAPLQQALGERDEAYDRAHEMTAEAGTTVMRRLGVDMPDQVAALAYAVPRSRLKALRLDALYHHPNRLTAVSALEGAAVTTTHVGEVASIVRDRTVDCDADYVGLGDVAPMTGELLAGDSSGSAANGSRFEIGDVLYSRLRPNLNKVWHADRSGCCSTEFRVLRTSQPGSSEYLALALLTPLSMRQLIYTASGNTHPRVADEDLLSVVLPWPDGHGRALAVEAAKTLRKNANQLRASGDNAWDLAKQAFVAALFG